MILLFLKRIQKLDSVFAIKFTPVSSLLKEYDRNFLNTNSFENSVQESEFIQSKILPELFSVISKLEVPYLETLIEHLLIYALVEWKEQCFQDIKFVGQIFGYISRIAPRAVVNEYLVQFSKDDAPPQIKYYILPEIAKFLKHPVKQVIADNISYHLIYFMKMKNGPLKASVAASDEKFIRPFWTQMQYVWSDSDAASLLPACVQLVDMLPELSYATLCEIIVASKAQFHEEDVPINTLTSTSVLILGLGRVEYESVQRQWEAISFICQGIFKHSCRRDPFYEAVLGSKEIRSFAVKLLCQFLRNVRVSSEDMLKDIVASVPQLAKTLHPEQRIMINYTTPQAVTPKSLSSECEKLSLLEELEQLVVKLKEREPKFNKTEKEQLLFAAKELRVLSQDKIFSS